MGRILGFAATAGLLSAVFSLQALAYTQTISQNGKTVHWRGGTAHVELAGNPINQSGISDGDFRAAVVRGLQRWQAAAGGPVDFAYWQGTDPGVYIPNSEYNGLSSIYFASNARGQTGLSPNVLGLTQVWYNTDNGEILETDVVLNDVNYNFTTNPKDTTGYGSSSSQGGRNVYIDNVITHELGHAFGLSHSGGLQSTMLFMESPEQAHLGCDEQVAIHALYPSGDAGARGTLTGTVVSETGSPVFGAHVLAISEKRGVVLATGITDKSGRYAIGALESGGYVIMAEQFFAGAAALSAYYSGINPRTCSGGQGFSRSFLAQTTSAGTVPTVVAVNPGSTSEAPALVARCSSGAAITASHGSTDMYNAPILRTGAGGFAYLDKFVYSNILYYRVHAATSRIEVHALAYSLYSLIHPSLELLDSSGRVVPARIAETVYNGASGYVNYDSALVVDGVVPGDYVIQVSAQTVSSSLLPAGPMAFDGSPFLVLTGTVDDGSAPPLSGSLANDGRCRMAENFPVYVSPAGDPPRHNNGQDGGSGFCGTIDPSNKGGKGGFPGDGPGPGVIAGWLLPWLAMAAIARLMRRLPAPNPVC